MDILQTGYELDYFKAELGFKFKFQIQFPEILAKFTIETVFVLYQHQTASSKICPCFEEIKVQMCAKLKELKQCGTVKGGNTYWCSTLGYMILAKLLA